MLFGQLHFFTLFMSSWSIIIPQISPDSYSSDLALSSVVSEKFDSLSSTYNSTDNGMPEHPMEIKDKEFHMTILNPRKMTSFFLFVTSDNLTLHTLNTNAATNLLGQLPPFSPFRKLISVKLTEVANVDQNNKYLSLAEFLPLVLGGFHNDVDMELHTKINLLKKPVITIIMEESSDTSENNESTFIKKFEEWASFWDSVGVLPQPFLSAICSYNQVSGHSTCMLTDRFQIFILSSKPKISKRNRIEILSEYDFPSHVRPPHNKEDMVESATATTADFINYPQAYLNMLVDDKIKILERKLLSFTGDLGLMVDLAESAIETQLRKPKELRLTVNEDYDETEGPQNNLADSDYGSYDFKFNAERKAELSKREDTSNITIPFSLLVVGSTVPRHKLFRNVVNQPSEFPLKAGSVKVTWHGIPS